MDFLAVTYKEPVILVWAKSLRHTRKWLCIVAKRVEFIEVKFTINNKLRGEFFTLTRGS